MYQGELVVCDTPEAIKAMTTGELIALWPSDLRKAHDLLVDMDDIVEVQTYGDQLRIFVQDGADLMAALQSRLAANGINVLDIRRTSPRMEEAFISLIKQQMDSQKFETINKNIKG